MPQIVVEALVAVLTAFGIGGVVVMVMRARHLYGWPEQKGRPFGPGEEDLKLAALKSNEKLALEKLDVVRQAIAMGWKDAELKELDGRLEKLVGTDSVARIVSGSALPSAELSSGEPGQTDSPASQRTME